MVISNERAIDMNQGVSDALDPKNVPKMNVKGKKTTPLHILRREV